MLRESPLVDAEALVCEAPVVLVGGGDWSRADFDAARRIAPIVMAADGGADALQRAEILPQAVIGDMDSVRDPAAWRARVDVSWRPIAEQDSTDFEKCLRLIKAPLIIALGFTGDRLDHTLAAMHALAAHPQPPVILIHGADLMFSIGCSWCGRVGAGSRVSIWPFAPVQAIKSHGLRWPLDGLAFAPGRRIGTSNEATADTISVTFDQPGAAMILPKNTLPKVAATLIAADAPSEQFQS